MVEPQKKTIEYKDKIFDIFYFANPMFHEDWHKAEEMGLEYLYYSAGGNDYWDHTLWFCYKKDKEILEEWRKSCWGE